MQNALRWAVCLVMAATSAPAFAHTGERAAQADASAARAGSMTSRRVQDDRPFDERVREDRRLVEERGAGQREWCNRNAMRQRVAARARKTRSGPGITTGSFRRSGPRRRDEWVVRADRGRRNRGVRGAWPRRAPLRGPSHGRCRQQVGRNGPARTMALDMGGETPHRRGMALLREERDHDAALERSVVLEAMGIAHEVQPTPEGRWALVVDDAEAPRRRRRSPRGKPRTRRDPRWRGSPDYGSSILAGAAAGLAILAFAVYVGLHRQRASSSEAAPTPRGCWMASGGALRPR